jgi:Tfp pilus assembly protein PilO
MKTGAMSKKATIALIVVGDVLLLAVGWFFLIAPQRTTAASIARSTSAVEAQLFQAKRPGGAHVEPKAIQQPEIATANLYSLAKAMPSDVDMPDLLLEVDQVARSAGVTLSTFSPAAPAAAPDGTYSTVPITLMFSGDFYSLTDLLYRLRSLVSVRGGALQTAGRLFAVNSVGLNPAGTGRQLTASVVVDAFVYGASAAPGSGAAATPPVATTGTDSTSTTTTPASTDAAPGP